MSDVFEPCQSQFVDRPMLGPAMAAIKEFHYDKGISPRCEMPMGVESSQMLSNTVREMVACGKHFEQFCDVSKYDPRYLRAHLILEECGEMLDGMFKGDVVETLDGLADLIYVLLGTAVQFGLPLDLAFDEVHASNMTKAPRTGARLRDKGDTYVPPNILACLSGTPYQAALITETLATTEIGETSFDFHEWVERAYPDIVKKWGDRLRGVLVSETVNGKIEQTYVIEYPEGFTCGYGMQRNSSIAAEMLEAWNNHRRSTSRA